MFAGYLYIHLREFHILIGCINTGCEPLTLYSFLGCEHVLKEEKDKNLKPSRRVSWLSNGYSGVGIPDILGSFPIQVTNLSSPIY
jgi:hypothetical protein